MTRITTYSTIAKIAFIVLIIVILTGDDCDECFSATVMALKFFVSGLVMMTASVYFKIKFLKTENIIFDVESQPLLETDEATDGVPFAGEGVVESDRIIKSPYTNTDCVYFHGIKEMYVKSGKSGRWEVVENIALFVPFYVKDDRGKLKIDLINFDDDFSGYKIPLGRFVPNPQNSEVDCDAMLKRNYALSNERHLIPFFNAGRYRWSEFVLRPETRIFAYGMVSRINGDLTLHEDVKCPLIISKKNRDRYVEEFYQGGNLVYLAHLLATIGYTAALFSLNYFIRLDAVRFSTLLFIGNLIIGGSVIFSLYNRIVTLRQRALNALSNVEIELKRRADLIPGIVETVKGYARHEREIQQIATESREKIFFSKNLQKEGKPVIPSLMAAIENYPELKALENFESLMKVLVDTEERIAYSREFYNRNVRKYNTLINQFSFLLVSSPLGAKEMDFISIGKEEKSAPQIQ